MSRFSAPLAREYKTYPELLRAQGYFTGVAGRTYHLDGAGQFEASAKVFDKYKLRTFPQRLDYVKTGNREQSFTQLNEFLGLVPKGKPFFLQLCSNDPHRPLDENAVSVPHDPAKLKLPAHYPDTRLVREDFARYYDEISRFDSDFGRIMTVLRERGLDQNTLVMFMGDNGRFATARQGPRCTSSGFMCRCWCAGRVSCRRDALRAELISGEDLAPTFLEAAGNHASKRDDGAQLLEASARTAVRWPEVCLLGTRRAWQQLAKRELRFRPRPLRGRPSLQTGL